MDRKILLAVDLSYQVYRATCAHPTLSCEGPEGSTVFTGGLYGFFQTFGKAVRETGATRVVFCQDVKPYRRSESYPEYKQVRKKAEDPEVRGRYLVSMRQVLSVLDALQQPVWGVRGFEVDDLIGWIVRRQSGRWDRIYAQANDSDLWQLLDATNFAIYAKDISSVVTHATLEEQGLTPSQHALMTALTGTHNDIAGIPGIGPGRGRAALSDPGLMRRLRESHGELIERNLALIKLPHDALAAEDPRMPPPAPAFNSRVLYRSLGRYDVEVTNAMVSAFEQLAV